MVSSKMKCAVFVLFMLVSAVSSQSETAWNFRTMKLYGANLGGWLSLERWIRPELFERYAPNATDEWTFCEQAANPAEALEWHWSTWITEEEIRTFASVKGNHLRVPVGYWAFITPDAGEPYVRTGQKPHLERLLGYCDKYDIYAFIDVHSAPGSQNGEHHSGRTGEIEFYTDYNLQRSLNTVQAIVDWVNSLNSTLKSRISGIQPVNEPNLIGHPERLPVLKQFYQNAYNIINASPYKIPMIFHDGFQGITHFADFLSSSANAVIDLHPYHAFPPNPNKTSIIENICQTLTFADNFHLPIIYGEWSLSSGVPIDDYDWFKIMMDTQVYAYKNGGSGFTFWTLKNLAVKDAICDSMESRQLIPEYYNCFEGIAWSFVTLVNENIINARTFSDTPSNQCPTQNPNSAFLLGNNVLLLITSLVVVIKVANWDF